MEYLPAKGQKPKATVIISVYNRIDFLKLVLAGFEMQIEQDFELIISDDGSGKPFVTELEKLIGASHLRIRHNWQEDTGFRKNRILNSSIQKALADYIIFVDGDCIPHPEFVAAHLAYSSPATCLAGRRTDLSLRITAMLTPANVRQGILQSAGMQVSMLWDYARLRLFYVMNSFYVKNSLLRKFFNRKERGLLGANFSLSKADLLAINGFDERYTAPTFGEDSDIELRLRLNNVVVRPVLNIAVLYHCYHKPLPRPAESKAIYDRAVKESRSFTPYGIYQER